MSHDSSWCSMMSHNVSRDIMWHHESLWRHYKTQLLISEDRMRYHKISWGTRHHESSETPGNTMIYNTSIRSTRHHESSCQSQIPWDSARKHENQEIRQHETSRNFILQHEALQVTWETSDSCRHYDIFTDCFVPLVVCIVHGSFYKLGIWKVIQK